MYCRAAGVPPEGAAAQTGVVPLITPYYANGYFNIKDKRMYTALILFESCILSQFLEP